MQLITPRSLSPAIMVAGTPHLLGFWPEESLIIAALSTDPRHPIVATMRVDLPVSGDSTDRADLLAWLPQPLTPAARLCDSFVAIVWSRGFDEAHESLIGDVAAVIESLGVPVADGLLVAGNAGDSEGIRWRSTLCRDAACCPAEGVTVTDLDTARSARVLGTSTSRPAASRTELEQELEPAAEGRIEPWPGQVRRGSVPREAFEVAVAHAVSLLRGGSAVCVEDVRLLAEALADVRVRDTVLWELLSQRRPRWATAAQALTHAVRALPDTAQAPTATCLAIIRWQMGDGARAMIAIEKALAADPTYSLAHLVAGCLTGGVPPADWRSGIQALRREDLTGCA